MWSLEKNISLDNIISKEESFSILTYTLSISSGLIYYLESFHLPISTKSNPHLGTCKDTLGTNDANGHKDLYLRREMLAEPHCQFWFLSPAASLAGPGCSSKTCTCTLPPQTNPICIRQKVHWSIKCCHCQSLQQSLTEELTGEMLHLLHLLVGSVQAMDRSVVAAAGILPVAMGLKKL